MFIEKIKERIPELIEKFDTLGINTFYKSFPDVKSVIFYDKCAAPKELIDNLIITDRKNYNEVKEQKNIELCEVITNRCEFSTKQNILNFYYFTSSMAINWAYLKGYKNVILCGIDLMNNLHFDDSNHRPIFADGVLTKTKKFMEIVCQRFINLYQLNPDSDLKIPKISLEKLLKGEINNV